MLTRSVVRLSVALVALFAALGGSGGPALAGSFVNFESGQVRPLALSPDGSRLFAVNTPDNRLEIFSLASGTPVKVASVPVGLEPVAVAARSDAEVWVVNLLSDSVSIVDVASMPPRVTQTLLVGDEPRDIVFAGPDHGRAFITTAHRGQNRPGDPQFTTPGIGRADVWVFDAASRGAGGGTPLTIVTLFADTPRALAVTPDGATVYAAAFQSGNQTTTVNEGAVCDGGAGAAACSVGSGQAPGGLPSPNTNHSGDPGPETGLIVKFNPLAGASGQWQDRVGRNWNDVVKFSLPDLDVFAIDANANPPTESESFAGVGTVLFNMAVNPVSGKVYVSNTDARNEVRFEGPGLFGGSSVRGHLHEARITVIDGGNVIPRHLNKHINYAQVPSPAGTKEASLATPLGMAVTSDGAKLYVAAFGSSTVGVFSTAALENDSFTPSAASHVAVSGGGPTGVVLDEARSRLYVATRFDDGLSVIDTSAPSEIAHLKLHDPEPANVVQGRPLLYDAVETSSNGEASCASCHIFGDNDSLAWDLGNPDDDPLPDNNVFTLQITNDAFSPLKGPMTTQSLRGMANHGPMHWRGDRSGANNPGGSQFDTDAGFKRFNPAFVSLIGRSSQLTAQQMQAFTDFILTVTYPPNPVRALDNSLNAAQTAGHDLFFGRVTDGVFECAGCHHTDPGSGFFGTDGHMSFENETQNFKIAHLRNAYTKVGMFGFPAISGGINSGNNGFQGDQIRGFGYLHDGSVDTLFRFLSAVVFSVSDTEKQNLQQWVLAFDSNMKPAVGQQMTRAAGASAAVDQRIALLSSRAAAGDCDLVVKGNLSGEERGWRQVASGKFHSDRAGEKPLTAAKLRLQADAAGQERTYSCVPPGSGKRIGVDRDEDGVLDRDELDAGSDPEDPASTPATVVFAGIRTSQLALRDAGDPTLRSLHFLSRTNATTPGARIVPPAPGSADDPRVAGALVSFYNSNTGARTKDRTSLVLPATGWTLLGTEASPLGYRFAAGDPAFPIQSVVVKQDKLQIDGGGAELRYTLDEPSQGRVALRFTLGKSTRWCADAGAKSAANDVVDRFDGQKNAAPPAVCPAVS